MSEKKDRSKLLTEYEAWRIEAMKKWVPRLRRALWEGKSYEDTEENKHAATVIASLMWVVSECSAKWIEEHYEKNDYSKLDLDPEELIKPLSEWADGLHFAGRTTNGLLEWLAGYEELSEATGS